MQDAGGRKVKKLAYNEILANPSSAGGNQSGLRDRNARVVLSCIRRFDGLSSAEIARRSGLSAQTVSNIIRSLEGEGLLSRGKAVKGKVGKPSVPVALNADGVLSLGLNIGRRAAELVLVDFNGKIVETLTTTYPYPEIERVFAFLDKGVAEILGRGTDRRSRIAGLGVARPNEIWNWLEIVKAPEAMMQKWMNLDLEEEVRARTGFDVTIENDATSACVAEHLLNRRNVYEDYGYIFIGAFVGAGLVLGGKVYFGRGRRAGALGPLPVPDRKGGTVQLLEVASLYTLEDALQAEGIDPGLLRNEGGDWSSYEKWVGPWIEETSHFLAMAAASIASIVEIEAILIDGAMPASIRKRVVEKTRSGFVNYDLTGLDRPVIEEATVGRNARSVGAAMLPIHSKYFLA